MNPNQYDHLYALAARDLFLLRNDPNNIEQNIVMEDVEMSYKSSLFLMIVVNAFDEDSIARIADMPNTEKGFGLVSRIYLSKNLRMTPSEIKGKYVRLRRMIKACQSDQRQIHLK